MDDLWKDALWSQFGATIDMFGNALEACPAELWYAHMWNDPTTWSRFSEFWYIAYHTLFWLDLYLTGTDEGFTPPTPYNLDELDPRGVLPERNYSKGELQTYLSHCRRKCFDTLMRLTDEKIRRICKFSWKKNGLSYAELLLDNMRHVQEHGAQLNMFLGQQQGISAAWIV